MFAVLWWKFPSKHSVMSHPSNSSLWDPVTLFSSLPTALTAWIKSTVTCVTTSPILLQTWGEYRFSSSPCLSVAATLQRSDVRASWLAALLTYSIWTPYRANTQDQSMKGHLGQSAHTAKAQGNDAHNADLIFPAVLYISVLLEFFLNIVLKIRYVVLVPQRLHLIAGCFYPSMSLGVQKVDITLQIRRALLQHHKMDWETFNHTGIFMLPNTSVYLYKKPRNCLLIPACH